MKAYDHIANAIEQNPKLSASWNRILPPELRREDWIAKLDGPSSPPETVTLNGKKFYLGSACIPRDCGDNTIVFLIPFDGTESFGVVSSDRLGISLKILGDPDQEESAALMVVLHNTQTSSSSPPQVKAKESPLSCTWKASGKGGIDCTITDNNIVIQNVILNRGNCTSPIPTRDEQRAVEQYLSSLKPNERMFIEMSGLEAAGALMVVQPKLAIAFMKVQSNPSGKRGFGDPIGLMNTCILENKTLIEFSVVTNGTTWTWKMH